MTKKEMVYEILGNTTLNGVNERETLATINKTKKSYIEKVYNEYLKDKEHSNFYFCLICRG